MPCKRMMGGSNGKDYDWLMGGDHCQPWKLMAVNNVCQWYRLVCYSFINSGVCCSLFLRYL